MRKSERMRYDFSCSDGHSSRMVPEPPGHHAGGQQGLGPQRELGRLRAQNPTVCDNRVMFRGSCTSGRC